MEVKRNNDARYAQLEKTARAHAAYLKKNFRDLTMVDFAMYLSLLAIRGVNDGQDAKTIAEHFTICLSNLVKKVIKSEGKE